MQKVNKEQFSNIISKGIVLVDFFAEWCGPCRTLGPLLEKLAVEFTDVNIIKVNVDEEKELAQNFEIRSIPAMLFFKNGVLVDKMVGMQQSNNIKEKLNALIER